MSKHALTAIGVLGFFSLVLLIGSHNLAAQDQEISVRVRRDPFHFVSSGRCPTGNCVSDRLVTPEGKRMVIETFSMEINVPPDKNVVTVNLAQRVAGGGTEFLHFAPINGPRPFDGGQAFVASQQVRLYPDPNKPVIVIGNTTSSDASFVVTISGYFVPIDSLTLSP
jgi:hypothetical protein